MGNSFTKPWVLPSKLCTYYCRSVQLGVSKWVRVRLSLLLVKTLTETMQERMQRCKVCMYPSEPSYVKKKDLNLNCLGMQTRYVKSSSAAQTSVSWMKLSSDRSWLSLKSKLFVRTLLDVLGQRYRLIQSLGTYGIPCWENYTTEIQKRSQF